MRDFEFSTDSERVIQLKTRKLSVRVSAWVTVFALLVMSFGGTALAAPIQGTTGKVANITPDLIERLKNSPVVHDYRGELPSASSEIGMYATKTISISAGGTVAISTDTYTIGDTLRITVSSNSGEALLYFYLMNSAGDMVGPKTLPVNEDLFVDTTGTCTISPHSGTYTFYINNDSDRATTIRMSYSILRTS